MRDGPTTLQEMNYTRDPVGNITEITDASQESVFFSNVQVTPIRSLTYDALYRLIEATGREKVSQTQANAWYSVYAGSSGSIPDATNPALRSYTQSYTYDEAGNLTEMAHLPSSGSGWRRGYVVADKNNQLVKSSKAGDDPEVTSTYSDLYAYKHRGAMVFMQHLDASNPNLTRDFRDQIRTAALLTSGHTATCAYDASGQRVRKVVVKGSIQEERIYLGSYEVWRKRSTGSQAQERQTLHILDGQRRNALVETLTVDDSSPPEAPSTRIRYQLDDHLGTAALETDEAGAVISYEEYHPYGSTAWYADDGSLTGPKRYRYTGMERDDETGLQYHSARYYAPWLGRWERSDPEALVDGTNLHKYARGCPTVLVDSDGCDPGGGNTVVDQDSFDKFVADNGNKLAEQFLDEFLRQRGEPAGWERGATKYVDSSTLGQTQFEGRADKLIQYAENQKSVAYHSAVAFMDKQAGAANSVWKSQVGYYSEDFELVPDASSTKGIVFFVDMQKLLSNEKYRDALLGRSELNEEQLLSRMDFSVNLTASDGSTYHVSFVDSSADRRRAADARLVQIHLESLDKARTAYETNTAPAKAATLRAALEQAQRAVDSDPWRPTRSPETWKAYAHEFLAHPAEDAERKAGNKGAMHEVTNIKEHKWFGW